MLINVREKVGIEILKTPKAFIDYLQTVDDVYKNFEDYNSIKERGGFHDMIANTESCKKLSPKVN